MPGYRERPRNEHHETPRGRIKVLRGLCQMVPVLQLAAGVIAEVIKIIQTWQSLA